VLASDFAGVLRLTSLLAGCLTVPMAFLATRRFFDRRVAVVAAWLCAISPELVAAVVAHLTAVANPQSRCCGARVSARQGIDRRGFRLINRLHVLGRRRTAASERRAVGSPDRARARARLVAAASSRSTRS
jgi:hypothetical protein